MRRFFKWLFPAITYEWCVIVNTIGRHHVTVRKEKCKNGTPCIAGGFLQVFRCVDEEEARKVAEDFQVIADQHNKERSR